MKVLKVTWSTTPWGELGQSATESVELPEKVSVSEVGSDTLVFKTTATMDTGSRTLLVIPTARLISAVQIVVEGPDSDA